MRLPLFIFTFVCLCHLLRAQSHPNVVFVLIDDLACVGSTFGGSPQLQMPNFQRLAERGVSFSRAFVNGAVCAPSRASALTGTHIYKNGYYGFSMGQNSWMAFPTMAGVTDVFSHFKAHGYRVYGTGKLFHRGDELPSFFTELFNAGTMGPYPWDGVSTNGNFPTLFPHPSMPAALSEPADGIAPLSDIPTIGSYTGWINRNGTPFVYVNDNERSPLVDDNVLQYAFAKLSTTDPAVPFFLTLGIQKPHLPFYLPKKYFDLYPIDEIVLPPILEADLVDVPVAFMNNRANNAGGYSGNRDFLAASADSSDNQWWLKRHLQGYYAGVSYVDDLLGQLLDSIDASPHANNTYIVLTSDHGYHFGDKNIIKKSTFWDAVSRVPLIIAGPGVPQNEVVDTPVSLIDLYPTFIELANLPPPGHTLDGYSLRPLLENPDETQWDGPGYAITGLASNEILPLNTPATTHHQHHCIRTATMRYARYATGEEELYDLNADPNEWFNLADDPNYAQEKATLRNQLETELGIVGLLPTLAANEVLYHGSFEQNTNGWLPLTPPAGAIQIISGSAPHGERYIRIPSTGNTIVYNANLKLTQGETYTLYFTARSNNPGSNLTLQIARNGEPDTTALYTFQNTLGIEWQTYSHTFTHTENTAPWNSRLVVTLTSPGIYFLDHVRVVRQAPDGLNEQRWQQAVNLFPNPAVYEPVRYQLPELPGANAYYTIHNAQGKRCREGRITTPEGVVFTEGLPAGTYFVTFHSGSYNTVRKLVLAR